jgi:hypothetical protein
MPSASQSRSNCKSSEWRGPGETEVALHRIACRYLPHLGHSLLGRIRLSGAEMDDFRSPRSSRLHRQIEATVVGTGLRSISCQDFPKH